MELELRDLGSFGPGFLGRFLKRVVDGPRKLWP